MNRKERREMERKVKHLQKTKPWELQALIQDEYSREIIDSRMNKDVLVSGDRVMLDVVKITNDPDWAKFRPEYQQFVIDNADKVFTLNREAKVQGPFAFVSFCEDTKDPPWLFYTGFVKKVKDET